MPIGINNILAEICKILGWNANIFILDRLIFLRQILEILESGKRDSLRRGLVKRIRKTDILLFITVPLLTHKNQISASAHAQGIIII